MALPYGLLGGQLCVSPETDEEYLLMDEVIAARTELTESNLRDQLQHELKSLAAAAQRRGKLALGWYVSGVGEDLQLDGEDLSLHQEIFPNPWQVVLLHDNSSGTERGAFVRYTSMTDRSYAIPFFELLADSTADELTEPRTALQWVNYRPQEPVSPLDEIEIARLRASVSPPKRSGLRDWLASWRGFEREPKPLGERRAPRGTSIATSSSVVAEMAPTNAVGQAATVSEALPTDAAAFSNDARIDVSPGGAAEPQADPPRPIASDGREAEIDERLVFINGRLVVYASQTPTDASENSRPSSLWRKGLVIFAVLALAVLGLIGFRLSV